jgi:hypothetical protein
MRKNRRKIQIIITMLMTVLSALPAIRHTSAVSLNPDQTILEVRQPGTQSQWGSTRTIHALHLITFRWKTDVPNTDYVEWQLLDYKPQPNGMHETPFATRKVKKMPAPDFQEFTIDFAHQQQQNPTKIPATAPSNPKNYWVRLIPWNAGGTLVTGPISDAVKITYVQAPPPPANPPNIENAFAWPGGHYVDLSYFANKPVLPLVTVSTRAPIKDAKGNPKFGSNAPIVATSLPFLSGYENEGEVELNGLKPKTHYHYIIEAKDEKGNFAYKAGEFSTKKRFVDVAFEKIFMIDDSDGFPSGAGDMNFAFFVAGINVLGPGKRLPQTETMDFPTGQTKTFDIFKTLEDPADNVTVRVNGSDQDDCGDVLHHPLCQCGLGSGGPGGNITDANMKQGTCPDGSGEFSVARDTLHIPDVTDRSQFGVEFLQKKFEIIADNGHLKFKVTGSFTVSYR